MPSPFERDEVLLPKEWADTVLLAKDSDLSFKAHIMDVFQPLYTGWTLAFEKYDSFLKLVQKDLTTALETESVAESVSCNARACLTECRGLDTDN